MKMIPPETLVEIEKNNLADYYTSHLAERRSFLRKMKVEDIMKWSNSLISKPLLNLPSELYETAVQLFKNLTSYMGDRVSSKKNPYHHLKKHLKLAMNSAEDLKDEAYVQVLKQIAHNPNYDKCLRGWTFLSILASSFAPSAELYYSLLNYLIYEVNNNLDKNIVKKANYIIARILRTFEQRRKQVPSEGEIKHIEGMKPIMFPVFFFSETHTMVPSESYTTVRELKSAIMRKLQLNISRIPYYALYEVCNKADVIEERFLDDMENVVDVTAQWEKEMEDYASRKLEIEFKIYLKIQLYYGYKPDDVDTVTMHYVQTSYDVNKGKFHLSEEDVLTLAAIQLSADYFGSTHEETNKMLERNLMRYVPCDKLRDSSKQGSYWTKKIFDTYTTLKLKSKLEAKLTYLEHLKQNSLWEAHQYYCSFLKNLNTENPHNFPEKLILGIKPTGLTIQDMDRNELLFVNYSSITSWGVNNTVFVLVLQKNEVEYQKFYFDSYQVRQENYIN
jgi:hypothetical protein